VSVVPIKAQVVGIHDGAAQKDVVGGGCKFEFVVVVGFKFICIYGIQSRKPAS